MKLKEILITPMRAEPFDLFHTIELIQKILDKGIKIKELAKDLDVYQLEGFYGLSFKNQPVGFLELEKVSLHDKNYNEIKMIYVIPEHRKSRNIGLFILGMKHILKDPIILGVSSWGGVVFNDGLALLNTLIKSNHFDVKKIDLETGETSSAEKVGENGNKKYISYVFEGNDPPPLIHKTYIQDFFVFGWQT